MELVKPSLKFESSFLRAITEFEESNIRGFWNSKIPLNDVSEYIHRTEQYAQGIALSEAWVPSTTLWLVEEDVFFGHVNIRHMLNDSLQKIGGHIGYAISPSEQGKGYGSEILRLSLPVSRLLGLKKILLTCDETNVASRKIIEKNGGYFDKKVEVDGKPVLHFWIDL